MNRFAATKWVLFLIGISGALLWGGTHPRSSGEAPQTKPAKPSSEHHIQVTERDTTVEMEVVMMGSAFVFVVDAEREAALRAVREAVTRLRALEEEISSWRPGSDISRLNDQAGSKAVPVGQDTFRLLELAKQLQATTRGTCDVTIGPVWDLWPFRDPSRELPGQAQIEKALELVDASQIVLDEATQTAYLPRPGMRVNLGAIGKGYAARVAADILRSHGIERAAISAGGDLYLLGHKLGGPWVVGVENPLWPDREVERFQTGDVAVATSGNSKRRIVREGKVYGHILDPRTGQPARGTLSVTVLTSDPTMADAFATAVFVMGPEEGLQWVESQPDLEALVIDEHGERRTSSGWKTRISPPQKAHRASQPQPPAVPEAPSRTTPQGGLSSLSGRFPQPGTGTMVTVPAGTCLLGEPPTEVPVAAFKIDRLEVTNRQYEEFLKVAQDHHFCHRAEPPEKDHRSRYMREFRPPLFRSSVASKLAPFKGDTFRKPDHPVVGVDWWDAVAYARWAGKRLPTRQEWEKAARGTQGRTWPWGDSWDPAKANIGAEMQGERDGYIYSAPARSFAQGASPYGALHMAGNVSEWVQEGAVMGGSSASNPTQVRGCAARLRRPEFRSFDLGFRCAAP